jgi:hypothetical protein
MNCQGFQAPHRGDFEFAVGVDLVLQSRCTESDSLLHHLLRLLVILADADHYGSTGEMALEMPGGRHRQQVRVDVGGLQVM